MRVRRALAVLSAAGVVSACGGSVPSSQTPSNLPNIAQVQSGIAGTILKYDHVVARVFCPTQVPQVQGQTFSCIGVATQPKLQSFVFQCTVHSGTLVSWVRTA